MIKNWKFLTVAGVAVLVLAAFVFGSTTDYMGAFHKLKDRQFSFADKACSDNIDNDGDGYIDLNGCDCDGDGQVDTSIGSGSALRKVLCEASPKTVISGYTSSCPLQAGTWYDADPECKSQFDDSEDAEHCSDGLYNEGEEGLDCGWTCSNSCNFTTKNGGITADETWSGNVYVEHVTVPSGVTLTIAPGTVVKFKYDRDYQTFDRGGIEVLGGTIIAQGTADEMIWFTSSAEDPINGDWSRIYLDDCHDSIFDFVIVEYGEMGIVQYDSSSVVSNSIIRWTNSEGLYAEQSSPLFENNLLYGNGYHEIALEQHNENVVTINNVFRDGHRALHNEETENLIEGNCFYNEFDGVTAGMESVLTLSDNHFFDIENEDVLIYGSSIINDDYETVNYFESDVMGCPSLNFEDLINFELGYIPGDEGDLFTYVYDEEDETRRVVKKIGEDLHFGSSLLYLDGYLYRFGIGDGEIGEEIDFIKIDPETGEYELFGNDIIMNAKGLFYDGEYFYVNDFSLLKIFKFTLNEEDGHITIHDSFYIPNYDDGGSVGMTGDDNYLYLSSRDNDFLYKLEMDGTLVGHLNVPGGSIVWTGEYFWSTNGGCEGRDICKYTYDGELVGGIYEPAKDAWAITWDGEYLWTIQRTCEMWDDPKIYQIEILDDSLSTNENPETNTCVDYEEYILVGSDLACCEGLTAYDCTAYCPGDYCCDEGEFICIE